MLKVGIVGIGNTGNQICALAHERLGIPVMAVNSSEKDLDTLPANIIKKVMKSRDGDSQGAGKDRAKAKNYLKDSISTLIADSEIDDMVTALDICFVISSTGGGTGSGTAPIMTTILKTKYPDTKFILVGILPVESEAYSSHVNTLEYLTELYDNDNLKDQTYMLYDNDTYSDEPSYRMMETVNNEVVNDIDVIRMKYNYSTKYDSIDENDMLRLTSFAGRIVVARVEDIKEKDVDRRCIEDMILDKLKRNSHVTTWGDKKVIATGIITNLSESLTEGFNNHIPHVREFIGESDHDFNHIYVTPDRKVTNSVYLIATGLSPISDRITRINERIEDIEAKQAARETENALADSDLESLKAHVSSKENRQEINETNVKSIFASFGC